MRALQSTGVESYSARLRRRASGFKWKRPLSGKLKRKGFSVVRTPTLLQMEAVECGAASLGIILGYYGRFEPLEVLRVACGVSRDGSKAHHILKAARTYGLDAKGLKKEIEDLRKLEPPFVVFWKFSHFLVINGFKKDRVLINDPATGPRSVSMREFDECYTGVVLAFAKGPDFQRGGLRQSAARSLLSRLPGNYAALAYVLTATMALALPNLVIPAFSKIFVDNVLVDEMYSWMHPLLLVMSLVCILKAALTALQQYLLMRLEIKLSLSSSAKFFWHVLRLPMGFFAQRLSGDIASRVEINDRVATLLSGELATNLANTLLIGFYAALLFRYNVGLTLLGLGISALNLVALQYVSRQRKDQNRRLLQEEGRMIGFAVMGLQSIDTLKATGAESDFFSRWAGHQAKVVNAQQELGLSSVMLSAIPPFLTALNAIAVIAVGARRVMDGVMTAGMLIAFQSLMSNVSEPVNQLVDLGGKLQEAQGEINRLEDVFRHEEDDTFQVGDRTDELERLEGHLELKNVTFGYSSLEKPLLTNFSLQLEPGKRVALVGGSGSGKSTIAKITSGLFEPWSGEVLLDGKARKAIPRKVLVRSLSVVDQEVFLFAGTVAENLTMWNGSVEEQALVTAAKDACIYDDIASRPGGFQSHVLEGGRNYGGGQRQRLELARALIADPRILILDEATSVLDAETEREIDCNIRRRGCTCLIVAHRLSTIRDCDEIIVLDRGAVVQRGTHESLLVQGGMYADLIRTL